MRRTFEEVNKKISEKKAVVVTAEEVIERVKKDGKEKVLEEVDVVTTATFGSMCSSGAFINTGHFAPKMRIQKAWLNGVQAYAGIAAVDLFIGATELRENDPLNSSYPGNFSYGGGHVIEDLVAGKEVEMNAVSYGTDCYPCKELSKKISLKNLRNAVLCNPRNAYQNYNVAVNKSKKTIYTYMGKLLPNLGNANYSSAGQLSPLLNDPLYEVIGIGTRVWLAGAQGHVFWQGTQHAPDAERTPNSVPKEGAGTLALVGNLKEMNSRYIRGTSFTGYGASMALGIGVPIPLLNERVLDFVSVSNSEIFAPVIDYSSDYPSANEKSLASVSYAELRSGEIEVCGKKISTGSLSSYSMAREIASLLKQDIEEGKFLLAEAVQKLPSASNQKKPGSEKDA